MKYVLMALLLLPLFAQAETVIGMINMQKVLVTIKEGQNIQKSLERSFNEKKKILGAEEEKIKKAQEAFMKQATVLKEDVRLKKETEIRDMILAYQKKVTEYDNTIKDQEMTLKKPILEKIRSIVDSTSKTSNVDVTFDSSTPILFAKNVNDITDLVIKEYDKKYPAK
ncbi:MAG: OmpH family outer membrane protein [Bacteriovoracaceae bacterium]|nr:OmpH family outer membrane protein [Bacteriovoracaceae bacterium]